MTQREIPHDTHYHRRHESPRLHGHHRRRGACRVHAATRPRRPLARRPPARRHRPRADHRHAQPGTYENSFTTSLSFAIHGHLTEVAADGSLKPELAESWEASPTPRSGASRSARGSPSTPASRWNWPTWSTRSISTAARTAPPPPARSWPRSRTSPPKATTRWSSPSMAAMPTFRSSSAIITW